ncbi:MAG: hypothetical protein WDO16_21245 [Bacteroidota bacterium]
MEELEIGLKYDPQHFREVYYKNGEGSVFTAQATQKPIWIIGFFFSVTIVIYALSFKFQKLSLLIVYAVMGTIAIIIYTFERHQFLPEMEKRH